ncbi:hypothetical protein BJV74DRAFT_860085, partial [Russula compacta]
MHGGFIVLQYKGLLRQGYSAWDKRKQLDTRSTKGSVLGIGRRWSAMRYRHHAKEAYHRAKRASGRDVDDAIIIHERGSLIRRGVTGRNELLGSELAFTQDFKSEQRILVGARSSPQMPPPTQSQMVKVRSFYCPAYECRLRFDCSAIRITPSYYFSLP